MANYKIKTSTTGIDDVINSLNKINDYNIDFKDSLDEIGQRYTKIAQDNLKGAFHTQKQGDELAKEIHYLRDKNSVTIVAGMFPDYIEALYYAEFGAGMVSNKHPLANEYGWEYDVNNHGDKGWHFTPNEFTKIKEIDGSEAGAYYEMGEPFKYTRENTGKMVAWVKSSEPTLFMYNTHRQMLSDGFIAKIIKDKIENIKY